MPDALYADPRLAPLYDPLDPDRSDLDAYLAMVEEFEARSVLDVGCGAGTFACLLAERGLDVVVSNRPPRPSTSHGVSPSPSRCDGCMETRRRYRRWRWILPP